MAAEKQNEVGGCWDEIGAPSVKRITSSEIPHPLLSMKKH